MSALKSVLKSKPLHGSSLLSSMQENFREKFSRENKKISTFDPGKTFLLHSYNRD